MSLFKARVAIVGIGEVPSGKFPERHCLQNALVTNMNAQEKLIKRKQSLIELTKEPPI